MSLHFHFLTFNRPVLAFVFFPLILFTNFQKSLWLLSLLKLLFFPILCLCFTYDHPCYLVFNLFVFVCEVLSVPSQALSNLYRLFISLRILSSIQGRDFCLILAFLLLTWSFTSFLYMLSQAQVLPSNSSNVEHTHHGALLISCLKSSLLKVL